MGTSLGFGGYLIEMLSESEMILAPKGRHRLGLHISARLRTPLDSGNYCARALSESEIMLAAKGRHRLGLHISAKLGIPLDVMDYCAKLLSEYELSSRFRLGFTLSPKEVLLILCSKDSRKSLKHNFIKRPLRSCNAWRVPTG